MVVVVEEEEEEEEREVGRGVSTSRPSHLCVRGILSTPRYALAGIASPQTLIHA